MWLASYLAALAESTGWQMSYLLWSLPFSVGLQLRHAYTIREGHWTIPVQPPEPPVTDDGIDDLLRAEPAIDE